MNRRQGFLHVTFSQTLKNVLSAINSWKNPNLPNFQTQNTEQCRLSTSKMITLQSWDGEQYVIEEAVALESQTIKHMVEDDCADNVIPLPNVTGKILAKVLEYFKKHVEEDGKAGDEKDLKTWDEDFVNLDQATLFDVFLAANYLNIKGLLDLTCQKAADMTKGLNPEEVRKTFNITNDFTSEEEEEVRRENQWAFE